MTDWPFISVVVPTYNRPQRLARCLRALVQQTYPRNRYEIIVVNDGGGQSTENVVAQFKDVPRVCYVYQKNQGPAVARNKGARQANGRFLAFTDDDCAPASSWLHQLVACLKEHPDNMVGGYTMNALPRNPFSITSQLLIDYLYYHYNRTESQARFFTSNNFAVATDLFWRVGGFANGMPLAAGEDRELCARWLGASLGMIYLPRAIVFHAHRLGIGSFWRQHFNYGRGAWLYRALRKHQTEAAVYLEPPIFYWRLIGFPLTMAHDIRSYILTGMLCFTQAANASGFLYERFVWHKRQKKKLP